MAGGQHEANDRLWERAELVTEYERTDLRAPEAMILINHRDALAGEVLEIGCGAGRLTLYLAETAARVRAIDVSESMLAAARRLVPSASFERRDLRELAVLPAGAFTAVVAGFNVLDVLGPDERILALASFHRLLAPGGTLVFSSHNLAAADDIEEPLRVRGRGLMRGARALVRSFRWRRNRRALLPLEEHGDGYAVLNDLGHDFQALHYYVRRDDQETQLRGAGFELVECLRMPDGAQVPAGSDAPESSELHYVARRA